MTLMALHVLLSHRPGTLPMRSLAIRTGRHHPSPRGALMRSVSPSLSELAHAASDLGRPIGRLDSSSHTANAVDTLCPLDSLAQPQRWLWMHGVRCGPVVAEVAVPCGWCVASDRAITVAADRHGVALIYEPCQAELRAPRDVEELVADATLRLLGAPTPPPWQTPDQLCDAHWLDQLLEICLISPLGEPPPWQILASLHPCATRSATPELIRHERQRSMSTWASLKTEIIEGRAPWGSLDPALAAWFDEGSMARWLWTAYPDQSTMLNELEELLRPADFGRVIATIGTQNQGRTA